MGFDDIGATKLLRTAAEITAGGAPARNVIVQAGDVPAGRYENFANLAIPSAYEASFALFFTSEKTATILVSEQASKHHKFELERRIFADSPNLAITWLTATSEIVRGAHLANQAQKVVDNTEVETQAWKIVDAALAMGASDLHIETRGAHAEVFARVYGERVKMSGITTQTAIEMCNVLYSVHADEDNKSTSWSEKEVLDTVIPHEYQGRPVQLRFSSSPIHPSGNFHAVFRLLVMDVMTEQRLDESYTLEQVEAIEEMLVKAHGAMLLVGPTNSGKSTSMQALIRRVAQIRGQNIKIITVEQPVEYVIPNACQLSVNDVEDFHAFLKGTLRQDPDVAMVGEINDEESAKQVKQLGLAGKKLFSTLHLNQAMAIFARLRELGIPDSVLFMEGFIAGVICQRLVPRLCKACSIPVDAAKEQGRIRSATYERVKKIREAGDNIRVRGDGCEHCGGMGIVGRVLCAEVLTPDETFLELAAAHRIIEAKQHWAKTHIALDVDGHGVTMVAHAIRRIRAGEVDPSHVETYVGTISGASADVVGDKA